MRVVFEPEDLVPARFRLPYGATMETPPRKGELVVFPDGKQAFRVAEVEWSFDHAGYSGAIITLEV